MRGNRVRGAALEVRSKDSTITTTLAAVIFSSPDIVDPGGYYLVSDSCYYYYCSSRLKSVVSLKMWRSFQHVVSW